MMAKLQSDRAFFREAILDTVVPETSDATLPEALGDTPEEVTEDDLSLISIRQRTRLFFGMQTPSLLGTIISYSFTDGQMSG